MLRGRRLRCRLLPLARCGLRSLGVGAAHAHSSPWYTHVFGAYGGCCRRPNDVFSCLPVHCIFRPVVLLFICLLTESELATTIIPANCLCKTVNIRRTIDLSKTREQCEKPASDLLRLRNWPYVAIWKTAAPSPLYTKAKL